MCYTFISLLLDLEVRSDGQLRYVLLAWGKELYQWDEISKHFRGQYTFISLIVLEVRGVEGPLEPPPRALDSIDPLCHALIAGGKDRDGLRTFNFLRERQIAYRISCPTPLVGLSTIRRVIRSQCNLWTIVQYVMV